MKKCLRKKSAIQYPQSSSLSRVLTRERTERYSGPLY